MVITLRFSYLFDVVVVDGLADDSEDVVVMIVGGM